MALIQSGGIGRHFWKLMKQAVVHCQTGTLGTLKSAALEDRMAHSLFLRRHNSRCFKTDVSGVPGYFCRTADRSSEPSSLSQKKRNVLSHCLRQKTTLTGNVISDLTKDIDIEELKKQVKEERMTSDKNVHLHDKLQETIRERSDKAIASLSAEDQKKLKVIQLEHSFMYSEGYHIPSPEEMCSEYWLEAMNTPSKAQRLKYYSFLCRRNFTKENAKKRKETKREVSKDPTKRMDAYEHGRIFLRIYESTMIRWNNHQLATAMQFGIPLVLDMDYTNYMRPQDVKNTAAQLHDMYCLNRADEELPFHLHLTGCADDNPTYRLLQLRLQENPVFLATVTNKSYMELFDREQLVYLSPNGRQVMKEFDPNVVYIIGAYNDKGSHEPVSYARAKEQGIKCLRLPLDEHVTWNQGGKDLTLDQMMKIMRSLKNKQTWLEAFKALPKRKLRDA